MKYVEDVCVCVDKMCQPHMCNAYKKMMKNVIKREIY